MLQCVCLLVFFHGVLAFQMEGVLGLSDESSDSSPGYRESYYLVQMLPIQKLKGKPQKAFDRTAADLLALWPSGGWGAPHRTRAPVGAAACVPPQPAPLTPRHHPSAAVPAPPTQAGPSGRRGRASAAGDPGNHVTVSASFPPTPRVLPTPGVPTVGALPSTSVPTSPAAKEPRGDV